MPNSIIRTDSEADRGVSDNLDITYIGDRFKEQRPRPDTDALDLEDPPTSRVPRKRSAIEALETELEQSNVPAEGSAAASRAGDQAADGPAPKRRITMGLHVELSAATLSALDTAQPEKKTVTTEWLSGSTQYAVDSRWRRPQDIDYVLPEPELPRAPPIQHRVTDRFQCLNCKRIFSNRSELRHHARRYEKRPYQCDQCNRTFLYPKDLRRHQTTHSGTKQYRCNTCPKAFSRKDNLRRHVHNEHPGVQLTFSEVDTLEAPGNQRQRDPSEHSEDGYGNQNNPQNPFSLGQRTDAAHQSGSEEQSGAAGGGTAAGASRSEGHNNASRGHTDPQYQAQVAEAALGAQLPELEYPDPENAQTDADSDGPSTIKAVPLGTRPSRQAPSTDKALLGSLLEFLNPTQSQVDVGFMSR